MEKSVLIQKQIKDNAQDLHSFMSDMKNWETEMKRKESELTGGSLEQDLPPIRSELKKTKPIIIKQKSNEKRINSSDYASWEKFDVDKACEMVDSENVGPSSLDSKKSQQDKEEKLREEAQQEKDRGNKFVRLQKWDEAISCYNRAIKFCCTDAIYYANRGFCYLKKENMYAAESDCSRALDIDPQYVKALQRRSTARLALGSLKKASEDLQRILDIEPSNQAVKQQLRAVMQQISTTGDIYKSPVTTPSSDDSSKSFSELFESNEPLPPDSPERSIKIREIKSPTKEEEAVPTVNLAIQEVISSNVDKEEQTASPSFVAIAQSSSSRSDGGQTSNDAAKSELDKELANQILLSLSGTQNLGAKTRQEIVLPIDKPPHLRSKKPLVRVPVSEIPRGYMVQAFPIKSAADGVTKVVSKNINKKGKFRGKRNDKRNQTSGDKKPGDLTRPAKLDLSQNVPSEKAKPSDKPPKDEVENINELDTAEVAKIVEVPQQCVPVSPCVVVEEPIIPQQQQSCIDSIELNKLEIDDLPKISFQIPKSSVQFTSQWRLLKGRDKERCAFLKSVPPTSLPDIFQNFLESDTLSEILATILDGEDFNKADGVLSLPYLQSLCKVKRFGALAMFLSNADKQGILKILERCKEFEEASQEDINDIKNKYEL